MMSMLFFLLSILWYMKFDKLLANPLMALNHLQSSLRRPTFFSFYIFLLHPFISGTR